MLAPGDLFQFPFGGKDLAEEVGGAIGIETFTKIPPIQRDTTAKVFRAILTISHSCIMKLRRAATLIQIKKPPIFARVRNFGPRW